jgi:hypothetical protein
MFALLVKIVAITAAIPTGLYLGNKFMDSKIWDIIMEQRQNAINKAMRKG